MQSYSYDTKGIESLQDIQKPKHAFKCSGHEKKTEKNCFHVRLFSARTVGRWRLQLIKRRDLITILKATAALKKRMLNKVFHNIT